MTSEDALSHPLCRIMAGLCVPHSLRQSTRATHFSNARAAWAASERASERVRANEGELSEELSEARLRE
eukprot:405995-Prymnesium_polylepis.1